MAEISVDNGRTFVTAAEALDAVGPEVIAMFMDDEIREAVHSELAPCTELEFLERYLQLAKENLIIG